MKSIRFVALIVALAVGGCAGLNQFPDVSRNYAVDLGNADPDYKIALSLITGAVAPGCSATTQANQVLLTPAAPDDKLPAAQAGQAAPAAPGDKLPAAQAGKAAPAVSGDKLPAAQAARNVYGCGPAAQKRIRNDEIDRRLRVIDVKFTEFQTGLAQENVRADFGIGVVEIGVGGAGALVSETLSQILSAVSGGLAGTRAAYTKAALFDQALPALLAQMIAGRKTVLVRIYQGRTLDIDEYPLSAAVQDLEAYYFAGSLPGALLGTSADASVKNDEADVKLIATRDEAFVARDSQKRVDTALDLPDALPLGAAWEILQNPPSPLDEFANVAVRGRLGGTRLEDAAGLLGGVEDDADANAEHDANAKAILKMVLVLIEDRSEENLGKWTAAIIALRVRE